MIVNINRAQVNLTADFLSGLNPSFSFAHGRRFRLSKQEASLNQILRSVLKELKNSPEELDELMPAFKELKEKGYADHEIDKTCILTRMVTKIKHYYSKKTTAKLLKNLEKYVIQDRSNIPSPPTLNKHEIRYKILNLIDDHKLEEIKSFIQDYKLDTEVVEECLVWAVRNGTLEAVNIFLPLVQELNSKDTNGETLLMRSISQEVIRNDLVEKFKLLINFGADPTQCDKFGRLPIHKLLLQKYVNKFTENALETLIPYIKDINAKDYSQNTVLHYAAYNAPHLIQMLLKNGSDANSVNHANLLPLHIGIHQEIDISYIVQLLDETKDINVPTSDGYTPLHVAADKGLLPIVELLIAKGANSKLTDIQGRTPAQLAKNTKENIQNIDSDSRGAIPASFMGKKLPDLEKIITLLS